MIEKKECGPKKAMVKKDVKSKVAARNGCEGRLMVEILIMAIQVNLVPLVTLDFTFFTIVFLEAALFFYNLDVLDWISCTSFCICIATPKPAHG